VVPVYGQPLKFARCLESILRWTNPEVLIIVADDCSPGDDIAPVVEAARLGLGNQSKIEYLLRPQNLGFVGNVNEAIRDSAEGDLVIVNSDVVVGPEWLERLQRAAYSSSRVATATPMTNQGTICSIPDRNAGAPGLPQKWTIESAARAIAAEIEPTYPDLPTAVGHCMYIRRDAIELIGGFDEAFSPGYSEEVDFSQRAIFMGLRHVMADDVFVEHSGNSSFGSDRAQELSRAHQAEIERRYPAYEEFVMEQCASGDSPLAAALLRASRILRGWSITIDARCLSDVVTGTQVHALQVIHSLVNGGDVRVRVLVPDNASELVEAAVCRQGAVAVIREHEVQSGIAKSDIVHRPFQLVASPHDVRLLDLLGERLVVTHQDLIAFHNPSYFAKSEDWFGYRRGTAAALGLVDFVVFFSHDARQDALSSGLVEAHRSGVVYIGTDHTREPCDRGVESISEDKPHLVCLGTDFAHKNRVFALKVLKELVETHGWDGRLVFIGPHVLQGSSGGDEAVFFLANPELRERVLDFAAVEDAVRDSVISSSVGVVYPTTFEGFGLVPFEAADLGVPCFFASGTSITETLGSALATLVPWNERVSAFAIAQILASPTESESLVSGIREASMRFRWAETANGLLRCYGQAINLPPKPLRDLTVEVVALKSEEHEYVKGAVALANELPPFMVGPLLFISRSPVARTIFFGPFEIAKWFKRRLARSRPV